MKKKFILAVAILLIAISLAVGIWAGLQLGAKEEIDLFTYPLLVGDKTYVVTVESNWAEERAPSVSLLNSSDNRYPIELYFLEDLKKKLFPITSPFQPICFGVRYGIISYKGGTSIVVYSDGVVDE
jgi:hypothetical protein